MADEKELEIQKAILEALKKANDEKERGIELDDKKLKQEEQNIKNAKEIQEVQEKRIKMLEEELKHLTRNNTKTRERRKEREQQLQIAREALENARKDEEQAKEALEIEKERLDTEKKRLETQKEINKSAKEYGDFLKGFFSGGEKSTAAITKQMSKFSNNIEDKLTKNLVNAFKGAESFGAGMKAAVGPAALLALFIFTKAIFDLAITVGNAENAFMKTTGASEDFARSLSDSYIQTRKFGASIEETSAAMNSLFTSFTDFTMVGEKTRENLTQTATVMAKLGVSTDDFAKGIQSLTKAMGFNADAAAQQLLNLEKFAEELGFAPSKIASDFAGAGGSLAKFGDRGVETFKRLEVASKITGMAFERILSITEKFDTFEGAATQAGKLNAALGGNFVNAMDLMMQTDPVGRFEQIRDAILSTGLSFDDMTYYQKNMYKEMLGLQDVGELALLLSGRTDLMADSFNKSAQSYEEAAERAKTVASFQEQLQILFAEMIPIITPVIDVLRTFVKILQPLAPIIGLLAKFIGLALTLSFIFSPSGILVMGITAISNVFVNMAGGIERINKQMDDFIEGWSKFARRLFHTRNSPTIFEGVGMLNDMFEDMDQNIQGTTVSIRAQTAELNNSPVPSVAETTANIETPSLAERAIRTFTGGEQNAAQTVEKPVELVLNGDKLGKFIVKVVGENIKTISIAQ